MSKLNFNFYELSLGGQLLIWSSRLIYFGKKNKIDNSYLVNMAYLKAKVIDGYKLQYKLLSSIINNNNDFRLMQIHHKDLNKDEILLTHCILDFSRENFYSRDYLSIWKLEKNSIKFFICVKDLSIAYKKANLFGKNNNSENIYSLNKTLLN